MKYYITSVLFKKRKNRIQKPYSVSKPIKSADDSIKSSHAALEDRDVYFDVFSSLADAWAFYHTNANKETRTEPKGDCIQ